MSEVATTLNQTVCAAYYDSFKGHFGKIQVDVLTYLWPDVRTTSKEIALELNTSKQHVSKILQTFREQGYVLEETNPADKRERFVFLTDKGKSLVREHIDFSNKNFLSFLKTLSEEENHTLHSSLSSLMSILKHMES